MKSTLILITFLLLAPRAVLQAAEFHVSVTGKDSNPGTQVSPFRTLQHAADLAQPGDRVTVHAGVYRERIDPPRGGESDAKRITYRAAPGEKAVITGSELIKNWTRVTNDVWSAIIPNAVFGAFNPYSDVIQGDWCTNPHGYHTGAVYLDGDWLLEAANLDDVLKPAGATPLWFGRVTPDSMTLPAVAGRRDDLAKPGCTLLWAQFPGVNPNERNVEINVRQTVFTPTKPGIDYLTVRGFELRAAATQWAPPTAAQRGIISAYWNKGWIIEGNTICYSPCCGVALGKYGDAWDNQSADSAEGYVGTIQRALSNGWNRATVGGHIVRDNTISHCEQTGIVGSLGCAFSTVTGNVIHDIHVRDLYGGAEMAGIKFHGAIDVTISRNHIYRTCLGLWLDWMCQGTLVADNLMHANGRDVFLEMQHGPMLLANNLFLSRTTLTLNSQGIACAHNLIAGAISSARGDTRSTPYQQAHSTAIGGMCACSSENDSGDHRFHNNLFVAPCNLQRIDNSALPCFAVGNVFTKGSQPSKFETEALLKPDWDTGVEVTQKADGWYLELNADIRWSAEQKRRLITTGLFGNAKVPDLSYENPDGTPLKLDTDYFGNKRNAQNPFPGPFETLADGKQQIKVWPK